MKILIPSRSKIPIQMFWPSATGRAGGTPKRLPPPPPIKIFKKNTKKNHRNNSILLKNNDLFFSSPKLLFQQKASIDSCTESCWTLVVTKIMINILATKFGEQFIDQGGCPGGVMTQKNRRSGPFACKLCILETLMEK